MFENEINQIEMLWKNPEVEKKLDGWLSALKEGQEKIIKAKRLFHQWNPLRIYVSVSKAKAKNLVTFSVRFFGQEVAELLVKDKVTLRLRDKHIINNKRYFKSCPLEKGNYQWDHEDAKEFRKFFKNLPGQFKESLRSKEHRIESKFIEEMLKGGGKFGRFDLNIQPVMIGSCPLQFPVPFSANTGKPKPNSGHIDILARRRGRDRKHRLSVWELKKPGTYKSAASQSCLYAIQLLKILRSKNGSAWYKIFGFERGNVPKHLEIEAVVAISHDQKESFNKEKNWFGNIKINGDIVRLYAAFYEENAGRIAIVEHTF